MEIQKRWTLKPKENPQLVQSLAEVINVSYPVAEMLMQRGITDYEQAHRFFRPELAHLHDPFLMKDMDNAVEAICTRMANQEPILFFGDYDVDGTTSVAMMYTFFRDVLQYEKIGFYIPDRTKEGYGISNEGIDYAKTHNFSLVISLDCGTKSIEHILYAKSKNIDFIICDHHLPGAELPEALAILNPKQKDCNYPYKELSGCGVGFKLAQALCLRMGIPYEQWLPLLDLVAVSTCCDIVPITGENRVLVHFGLERLNTRPRPGLSWILENSGIFRDFTVEDVVFVIGPKINAAGRMKHGSGAVKLLIGEEENALLSLQGEALQKSNIERRGLDKDITREAWAAIQADKNYASRKSTVVFNPAWHKGVIGIVASRLIEKHYRPTVVLTGAEEIATGSARSIKGFDLHSAIEQCAELLETFGGHMHAAGLSMKVENVPAFKEKFESIVAKMVTDDMLIPEIEIDTELPLYKINTRFFNVLKQFAPFGPENMTPVFSAFHLVAPQVKIIGEHHLKLSIRHADGSGEEFQAIAFKLSEAFEYFQPGRTFDMAYCLKENHWNGKTTLQIEVRDFHFHS